MKTFVRTPWVQSALAWLVSAYLGATLATMRWRFENLAPLEATVAGEGGVACFWHGRIALAVACRRVLKQKPRRVLISNSPDGELIAKIVERLSFPAIRGSWDVRPAQGSTQVIYVVYSEPGGSIPPFLSRGCQRSSAVEWMRKILARLEVHASAR